MVKKTLIFLIPIVLIGIASIILLQNNNNKNNSIEPKKEQIKKEKKRTCESIVGGSFDIVFNTDSDKKIDNMNVCIACPPDSYENLPKAEKTGFNFENWYYDKELTKKVEANNTIDITPIPKKENNCIVGYETINLYAKYTKIEQKIEQQKPQTNKSQSNQQNTQEKTSPGKQTKTYQTSFKKPFGTITLFKDGGSFGPQPSQRPYIAITSMEHKMVMALADGEIITIIGINSDIGGIIITKQTIYSNGTPKDYLILLNHIIHTDLKIGDTFTGGQIIGIASTGKYHGLSEYTRRYSIYAYDIYNEQIKNRLRSCHQSYNCIKTIINDLDFHRINILDKIQQ